MKKKILACLFSMVLIVGLSGSVMAVTDLLHDTVNEPTTGDYDIASADCLVYPPSSVNVGVNAATYLNVNLQMDSSDGGKLPGMIIVEFDVDNDDTTGGALSMVGIMPPCEDNVPPTNRIKTLAGTDIYIVLLLRESTNDSATAWCDGCSGPPGRCFLKETACSGTCGGTSDCYKAETSCDVDDANCYIVGDECNEPRPTCDKCYEMTQLCTSVTLAPCDEGRIVGEWFADIVSGEGAGGGVPAERGRLEQLPTEADQGDADCYRFPWARIVQACADKGGDFDFSAATDPANARYQVSTWYDVDDNTPPANDFFEETATTCAEVCDVVPNTGLAVVSTVSGGFPPGPFQEMCEGDFDGDGAVGANDVTTFLNYFGRSAFNAPCPSCHACDPSSTCF